MCIRIVAELVSSRLLDIAPFFHELTVIFHPCPFRQPILNVHYTLLVEHMISGCLLATGFWREGRKPTERQSSFSHPRS
jgi:hypothetical protein